jgi:hypothetical protein
MHARTPVVAAASVADGYGLLVGELDAGVGQALLHVDISSGSEREEDDVDDADHGEQPVEVIEPAVIEVVREPSPVTAAVARDLIDDGDEQRAEEEADRAGAEEESRAHCLHALGALAQEEGELAHVRERLAGADEHELRHEQEDGDGDAVHGGGLAVALDDRGHGHAGDGEEEADEDPLERAEAVRVAREALDHGREETVVDGHGEEDGADEEDGEGARGDEEARAADAAVHELGLRHREGGHLRVDGPEHDGGGPDGQHPHHLLHLLHVRPRAQRPLARRRRGLAVDDGGVVKEPASFHPVCRKSSSVLQ